MIERLSLPQVRADLQARRDSLAKLHAQVDGSVLLGDVLALLDALDAPAMQHEPLLTLTAAASASGFSPDHLSRLVQRGEVPNYGRKHAPRVRLSECPQKRATVACGTLRRTPFPTQRARVTVSTKNDASTQDHR